MKKLHARELSRNQSILRFDVILQHDWPIEQCFLHIRIFFGGKTKSPCFALFIRWLIKQITNTYQNHYFKVIRRLLYCRWFTINICLKNVCGECRRVELCSRKFILNFNQTNLESKVKSVRFLLNNKIIFASVFTRPFTHLIGLFSKNLTDLT